MALRGGHAAAAAGVSSGSEDDDEEAGFSRSYFLAKEKEPSSGKKRARAAGKLSDLNLVDEQVCITRPSWKPSDSCSRGHGECPDSRFGAGAASIPR
jgi:hypothetical protein